VKYLKHVVGVLIALAIALGSTAFGSPDVTKARVEASLTPTFTNLYLVQQQLLGHPQVTGASVQPSTSCDRGGPKVADTGAGRDWICMITFTDDTGTQQQGKFELQVHSNACWTASGPASLLGSFTITDTTGRDVPNPVNAFDGCFDPDAAV
jgi:hypothetical protein